jgi:hypothetical protein
MTKLYPLLCSLLLVLFSFPLYAQEREVLYTNSPSGPIQELAKSLRDPQKDEIPVGQLPPPNRYFVRIIARKYVLTKENKISETAVLTGAARPFVFLTTPEGFIGKSLLEIYADIGYEAEDVLRTQLNEDMVAVLFRYPDNVNISSVKNGNLGRDWRNGIYPTTWDNVFSLFTRLVQDERSPACKETGIPSKNICLPPQDRAFVMRFPLAGKRQLKTKNKTYPVLRATGGSLWRYRKLLEDKLSLFEHFRGDGRTENEVRNSRDRPSEPRLFEVIGPNMKINQLPELVVIHLGELKIEDCSGKVARRIGPRGDSQRLWR